MNSEIARIHRARVPARLARPDKARDALERWLAARDVSRYGFPRSAIVLVRRLRTRWAVISGSGSDAEDELATLLRGAVRPAVVSHVPAGAQAVWFADDAELLACIARDALHGSIAVHWWWRLVFSRGLDHAAAVERWTNGARAVPRAVRDLDAIGLARTWLGSLSKAECGALEAALAREFPIANDVQRYVLEGASAPANADTSSHSPSDDRAKTPQPRARTLTEREATANELTPHMRLCRLCLDLALDPGCARESGYSERELQRTRIDSENARVEISSQPPAATAQHRARAVRRSVAALRADRTLVDVAPQITSRFDGESRTAPAARVALAAAVAAQAHPEHRSVTADSVDVAPQAAHEQVFVSARTADAGVNAETIAFDTAYGGLFFVLNAALHLGLYGDFTRPLQRGLACSPWRLLLVAGRAWAGRRFRRDPLAAWLARKSQTGRRTARHDRAVDRVLPYLRARLALALGVPNTRGVTRIVLELAARVDVAADRLDAHYALAELPLAIRLAGLDRDPGWIPAAGSDVRFHFR